MNTEQEWGNLKIEIDLITQVRRNLPYMWLSGTEGDKDNALGRRDNWPETELVENEMKKLEAIETVWRDFYTGRRMDTWPKPYYNEESLYGETHNCHIFYTDEPWEKSWNEWECYLPDQGCPCSYPAQPLLRFFCPFFLLPIFYCQFFHCQFFIAHFFIAHFIIADFILPSLCSGCAVAAPP